MAFFPSFRILIGAAAFTALAGQVHGAGLYWIGPADEPELKWTTGIDAGYDDGATSSIVNSWQSSDPADAAEWLAALPERPDRTGMPAFLFQTLTNPDELDEAARLAVLSWLALTGSPESGTEIIPGERPRGGGREDASAADWQTICSCTSSMDFMSPMTDSLPVVPEPSAALLAALGAVGVLRRRRHPRVIPE